MNKRRSQKNTAAGTPRHCIQITYKKKRSPDSPIPLEDKPMPEVSEGLPAGTGSTEVIRTEPVQSNTEPTITPVTLDPTRLWYSQYEAVVGLSHRNTQQPMPCQDAALSLTQPRPVLLVADGAGSSAVSEIGSQTVVTGLARLLNTLDKQLVSLLDTPASCDTHQQDARHFALLLVKHSKGLLDDLANAQRRPLRDFRCTLLLGVLGKARALWLKVGDGALVVEQQTTIDGEQHAILSTLGQAGKGEFANHTQFIDETLRPEDVQSGLLSMDNISGLAAMSDGAAEKLVGLNSQQVAKQVEHWLEALRTDQLPRRTLTRSFYSDAFCTGSSGDDCSLALLASTLTPAILSAATS